MQWSCSISANDDILTELYIEQYTEQYYEKQIDTADLYRRYNWNETGSGYIGTGSV